MLAQTGCPGCMVSLPDLPEDTIYMGDIPDGAEGVYYDESLSFRLPKTTTPVNALDPSVPAGLTITTITITSVYGMPPGISWEANQLIFSPASVTDGCVRFCGTPIGHDTFHITVEVLVQVSIISQYSTFELPMYISPIQSGDGFDTENYLGCGQTTATFINNVPSNGQEGYSYLWDFGNGDTSTLENPEPQLYDAVGEYNVYYSAAIDTVGYLLTNVQVLTASCNDFNFPPANNPDLFVNIINAQAQLVYTSAQITDAGLPANFSMNINLPVGNYTLEVWDDDSGLAGDDDLCGSFTFSNTTDGTTLNSATSTAVVSIIHPVILVTDTATITVLEIPDAPTLTADQTVFCTGDMAILTTNNNSGNHWSLNGEPLLNGGLSVLTVNESGSYGLDYTAPNGCMSSAEPIEITVNPNPTQIQFFNQSNVLTVFNPQDLPQDYSLVWVVNSQATPDTGSLSYCLTENAYVTLQVTDLATGCTNSFSIDATFNPATPCFVATSDVEKQAWTLSPNPGNSFTIQTDNRWNEAIMLTIFAATGAKITDLSGDIQSLNMQLPNIGAALPSGTYFVRIAQKGNAATLRFVKM